MDTNLRVIVGLGKTGMSCVRYLARQKCNIAVVDSRENPPNLDELRKDFPQIPVFLGSFDAECLNNAAELIVSPGVALTEPAITKQIKRGIKVIGDIELFVRAARAPIVAITGANGKSTVTTLLGEMAKAAGLKVQVGGNLGTPVLELLKDDTELYVLELSSFQLETTYSLCAAAAVVLNITPDHMDRYKSLDEYRNAKQRIYNNCKVAVINRDDEYSYTGAKLPNKVIIFDYKKTLLIKSLKIKGRHQIANAAAALALGEAIDLPMPAMLDALQKFEGLPHRCQWVANIRNVDWYDDSKGTNVGATKAAIEGLGAEISGKIILIAGGIGKDADFSLLKETVTKYVRAIVLIGEDAKLIAAALDPTTKKVYATSMQHAVELAAIEARAGDAVLLSPACASFDMFNNFEHRGDVFAAAVKIQDK